MATAEILAELVDTKTHRGEEICTLLFVDGFMLVECDRRSANGKHSLADRDEIGRVNGPLNDGNRFEIVNSC